jgi:hypothetical protein
VGGASVVLIWEGDDAMVGYKRVVSLHEGSWMLEGKEKARVKKRRRRV